MRERALRRVEQQVIAQFADLSPWNTGAIHSGVDREVRGRPNASDHAPVWIELKDARHRPPVKVKMKKAKRPLLVIDGDSFAHRSYHALPKSIMRKGDRPAGAILGFANRLLRFWFEKGTDLSRYTKADLKSVQDKLNTRPRPTLDYDTPAQRLATLINQAA